MNDHDNYLRFKSCLELIIANHPQTVVFNSLNRFTPNSFCTLLRKAKHHHVRVLGQPFPEDIIFRFESDRVLAGPKTDIIEPITPPRQDLIMLPRPLTLDDFHNLCSLLNNDVFSTTFQVPGTAPDNVDNYPNVELVQQPSFYLLL